MTQVNPKAEPNNVRAVLSNATMAAAQELNVNQSELAKVLGLSNPTISRMASNDFLLSPASSPWDAATTFLLVYRSLASILASNTAHMQAWFNSHNTDLGAIPRVLIQSPSGLHRTRMYLDTFRGRC